MLTRRWNDVRWVLFLYVVLKRCLAGVRTFAGGFTPRGRVGTLPRQCDIDLRRSALCGARGPGRCCTPLRQPESHGPGSHAPPHPGCHPRTGLTATARPWAESARHRVSTCGPRSPPSSGPHEPCTIREWFWNVRESGPSIVFGRLQIHCRSGSDPRRSWLRHMRPPLSRTIREWFRNIREWAFRRASCEIDRYRAAHPPPHCMGTPESKPGPPPRSRYKDPRYDSEIQTTRCRSVQTSTRPKSARLPRTRCQDRAAFGTMPDEVRRNSSLSGTLRTHRVN